MSHNSDVLNICHLLSNKFRPKFPLLPQIVFLLLFLLLSLLLPSPPVSEAAVDGERGRVFLGVEVLRRTWPDAGKGRREGGNMLNHKPDGTFKSQVA